MNGYYDPQTSKMMYEERFKAHREPIVLSRPKRARRRREMNQTFPAVSYALRSAARSLANLLT